MAGFVERYPPIDIERIRNHDVKAIVVLGDGSYQGALNLMAAMMFPT